MANQEQSPKGKSGRSDKYNPHDTGLPSGAQVGRDVPDESKERHTEIAVEAGKKLRNVHEKLADVDKGRR